MMVPFGSAIGRGEGGGEGRRWERGEEGNEMRECGKSKEGGGR